MNRRGVLAAAILVAWFGGVGMLVRREFFRPQMDRLAEAALRVTPNVVFFAVLQGDQQVGFASSTIDTATTEIEQRDYLVADIHADGAVRRAEVRTNVILTRTLRLKSFQMEYEADAVPMLVTGQVDGDSLLILAVARGAGARPDTQQVPLSGGMLLPSLVPLAVALYDRPRVGKSVTLPVFDAATLRPRNLRLDVRAESLFVVNDSSAFDTTSGRWRAVLPDTVRGWQVASHSGGGVDGWVDEQGRLIASNQLGFALQRRPYEVAFENWQLSDTTRASRASRASRPADATPVVHATLIASRRTAPSPPLPAMRATVIGPVAGLSLDGGRQSVRGDTVTIRRELSIMLAARYRRILLRWQRSQNPQLAQEPGIETNDPELMTFASDLVRGVQDPGQVAARIFQWVRDSVERAPVQGAPGALATLRTRRGDATEHAQLFVAMSRAAGVPARTVSGVVLADGRLHHHAWAEVLLRDWVAVDPTFGQLPAGATHLRLHTGAVPRPADLQRLIDGLRINVLTSR